MTVLLQLTKNETRLKVNPLTETAIENEIYKKNKNTKTQMVKTETVQKLKTNKTEINQFSKNVAV